MAPGYARAMRRLAFTIRADALEDGARRAAPARPAGRPPRRPLPDGLMELAVYGAGPSRAELEAVLARCPAVEEEAPDDPDERRMPVPPADAGRGADRGAAVRRAAGGRTAARRGDRLPERGVRLAARTRPRRCAWSCCCGLVARRRRSPTSAAAPGCWPSRRRCSAGTRCWRSSTTRARIEATRPQRRAQRRRDRRRPRRLAADRPARRRDDRRQRARRPCTPSRGRAWPARGRAGDRLRRRRRAPR